MVYRGDDLLLSTLGSTITYFCVIILYCTILPVGTLFGSFSTTGAKGITLGDGTGYVIGVIGVVSGGVVARLKI